MKKMTEKKIPEIEFLNAESGVDFHWWYKNETPLHSHTYYEIIVIADGPVAQLCNDLKYNMNKRDLFIMKPNDVHKFFASPYSSQLNFSITPKELKKCAIQFTLICMALLKTIRQNSSIFLKKSLITASIYLPRSMTPTTKSLHKIQFSLSNKYTI